MTTNIFTKYPKRGDILVREISTRRNLFITLDSFSKPDLSSVYAIVGSVVKRKGSEVLVVYKNNSSLTWCDRYSHKLTGFTLDGTARSGVLSIRENSSASANTDITVSYNATSLETFVSQLNAFFASHSILSAQDWHAQIVDGEVHVHYSYTFWQQASYNSAKSGFAMSANLLPDVPSVANIRRISGATGGEGVISSWDRALAYFRADNSSATYNPSSDVTNLKLTYPICLPGYLGTSQYQSDHCEFLRAHYGEGEEGWLKFMKSCLPVAPTDFGNMGQHFGKEMTALLASKTYTSQKKTNEPLCKAASYCYSIESNVVTKGEFYLPTVAEVYDILDGIHYGTNSDRKSDDLNKSLYAIGGNAISNGSHLWSCCRYVSSYAWSAFGSYGFFNGGNMCYGYLAVPVTLLKLS